MEMRPTGMLMLYCQPSQLRIQHIHLDRHLRVLGTRPPDEIDLSTVMEVLRISAKTIGELALPNSCQRCVVNRPVACCL